MPCWAQRQTVPTLRSLTLAFWSPWSRSRSPLSAWMCLQVGVRTKNTTWWMSLWPAAQEHWLPDWSLERCAEDKSYATVGSAWAHHTQNTLPADIGHNRQKEMIIILKFPFSVFLRLGCRRTKSGRDKPRRSHLTYSTKEVRRGFLREAFLGRTLPALWHPEKIRS